ncbi:DUF58 domain-containing protein [Sediminicola sp. 1XM1-17]|uniref:DUF58 domain-containing protein n=1 Tax=Sediminicola sp. 1XM1-17 TaxID=3127702 RepID=UPI0030770880
MDRDYRQLFQPHIINSISGLSLIARVIVDGYLAGLNKSRRVGVGLEFSQYRGYEPGDDLRLLDWKMLARSGRHYIKQSEIDTHISVKFIVDTSKSMVYSEGGISKIDFVKVMVASLAHLAQEQGDAIGLYALNNKNITSLQPIVQKQQYKRFLHELIQIKGEGEWPSNTYNFDKLHDKSRKELVFFITDMYEYDAELTTVIKSLKTKRNEVVVLQILGKNEFQFNYKGHVVFEDLETGAKVKVDAKEAKSKYLSALNTMMTTTKDMLLSNNIGYQLFMLDEPLGEALQLFLKQRSHLM